MAVCVQCIFIERSIEKSGGKQLECFLSIFQHLLSLTRVVAIDCEMVGVGPDGEDSILARVSLVNQFGKCIYDKYVKPTEKVTDYRTAVSGIRPQDIKNGELWWPYKGETEKMLSLIAFNRWHIFKNISFTGEEVKTVQREVAEILKGRIVVGHAIHNDLKVMWM